MRRFLMPLVMSVWTTASPAQGQAVYQTHSEDSDDSITVGLNGEIAWMQAFLVERDAEVLTAARVAFGTPAFPGLAGVNPGDPFAVYVWADLDGDLDPSTGTMLLAAADAIIAASAIDSDVPQTVDLGAVDLSDFSGFFLGVRTANFDGAGPAGFDQDMAIEDRAWVVADFEFDPTGDLNTNLVGPVSLAQSFLAGAFMISAVGQPSGDPDPLPIQPPGVVDFNWTFTQPVGGRGIIDLPGGLDYVVNDGHPIFVEGPNDGEGGSALLKTVAPTAGTVTCGGKYVGFDCCEFDVGQYFVDGVATTFITNETEGPFELEFDVPAGAEFGFAVFSVDGIFNVGRLFVRDFAFTPTGPECPADLDGSGDVGIADLLTLLAAWGQLDVPADFDGGGVGVTDLLTLLADWGPCP